MNRKQVTDLLEKIQAFRQSFFITDAVIRQWLEVLKEYDYEDVDKALDKYFKNGDNFGKYPDVYYLTKYLTKHDEKLKVGVNYIRCQNCQRIVELTEYNRHLDRCNSIEYLCDMSEKYYQKHLNKEKLFKMSDGEFEKGYWSFCEKLYEVMEDGILKRVLNNSILTHKGFPPKLGVKDLMKEVKYSK